ncbi:MAG: hypothetical protein ACO1SX_22255 [Actinomycetota bacterium]
MIDETCPVCAQAGRTNPGVIREQELYDNADIGWFGSGADKVIPKRLPHVTRRYACDRGHRWKREYFHAQIVWELDGDASRFGRIEACEQALTTEVSWPAGLR